MKDPNFEDLSTEDNSLTIYKNNIHEKNIHTLLTEIYKSLKHISPPILHGFFNLTVTPYSPQNNNLLKLPKTNTSRYDTQVLSFKGILMWNTVPDRYKNLNSKIYRVWIHSETRT